ncbi:MAG: hypothetical protein K2J38_02700, partial [Muribaculaceae bacterium]|nr:hypothetical protein [Muribaculaceae bacterium]
MWNKRLLLHHLHRAGDELCELLATEKSIAEEGKVDELADFLLLSLKRISETTTPRRLAYNVICVKKK